MARRDGITMWLDGEKDLYVNMQKRMDLSTAAGRKALQTAGLKIVGEAKENLRRNKSVVTGMLRASGKVQQVANDPDSVDAGFFSDSSKGGYAFFVEHGRRAGKMPPVDEIAQWLRKKHMTRKGVKHAIKSAAVFVGKSVGDYIQSLAWAIAKKIAREGTTPHPFFKPAIESTKKDVEQILKEAIKKEIDKNE
jgi:hypothetical protein